MFALAHALASPPSLWILLFDTSESGESAGDTISFLKLYSIVPRQSSAPSPEPSTSINFGVIVIVVVFVVVVVEAVPFFLERPLFLGSTTVEVVVNVIGGCSDVDAIVDVDVDIVKDFLIRKDVTLLYYFIFIIVSILFYINN